jgi:hypothetical protein
MRGVHDESLPFASSVVPQADHLPVEWSESLELRYEYSARMRTVLEDEMK